MSTSTLLRWCGMAGVVAGAATLVMSVLEALVVEAPNATVWGFVLVGTATQFALIGIYAAQLRESGWVGLVGFVLALSGNAFFIGPEGPVGGVDSGLIGGPIYALGLLLLAVATWRTGKFPRWVAALWIAAIVFGLPAIAVPALEPVLFAVGGVLFGLGFIGAGIRLWSGHIAVPPHNA